MINSAMQSISIRKEFSIEKLHAIIPSASPQCKTVVSINLKNRLKRKNFLISSKDVLEMVSQNIEKS